MSLAYWCLLAAALLPSFTVAIPKALGSYDNRDPRGMRYVGLAYRAHCAHQNGFEAFPFFAVAVLVASGGSALATIPLLNTLALTWVVLRLGYVAAYLLDWPGFRSAIWIAGFGVTLAIFTLPAWHA